MGFFDDLPPPPPPVRPPAVEPMPWMRPPAGWIGGWVPWHVVVMRNVNVYAVLTDVQAFPTGVLFTLAARFRPGAFGSDDGPPDPPLMMSIGTADGPLLGVGFADGRKTALHLPSPGRGVEPDGPLLTLCGGGGGSAQEQMGIWLWPLPPPVPLTLVTAWPRGGIKETTMTLDAAELVSAANDAEEPWPEEADRSWGFSRTSEIRHDPGSEAPSRDD
ncbi:MAG TPA: hypothetical protein VHG90_09730 [Acidimicrobiales bacterium]|nr:hypothetical protein [Acidimicrobiales bacterium]